MWPSYDCCCVRSTISGTPCAYWRFGCVCHVVVFSVSPSNFLHNLSAVACCIVLVDGLPAVAAASMWTRKDIKEFKGVLSKDADSVIQVGSGETVTVSIYDSNLESQLFCTLILNRFLCCAENVV